MHGDTPTWQASDHVWAILPWRSPFSNDEILFLLPSKSIKQLHIRMTHQCAEYRELYEKFTLSEVGSKVDWAKILEQKQVRVAAWVCGISFDQVHFLISKINKIEHEFQLYLETTAEGQMFFLSLEGKDDTGIIKNYLNQYLSEHTWLWQCTDLT